ncbi:MAG: Ldh family oxidoreductase [Candidatus Hodarchaeales archaeon]|jgi:LDH2 family malate/lactate/ureidoglycolate dehydrogenase
MTETILVDVETLENFMTDIFKELGVPEEDANICSNVLIASDLRGIESHGVQRLKMYYDRIRKGIQKPITDIKIIQESPTTARLDAGHGMGHVAAYRAMEMAIKKAKENGTGIISVGNSTHYGIAGYYPMMAIKEGMIGITGTNARPSIAPTFGVEPMMGTNPLTIGIPTDEEFPFLYDGATSITQRGKIEVLTRTGTPIPEGWVVDKTGGLVTDSLKALDELNKGTAALLPLGGASEKLGGHKGYGYAAAVEILSAALWGGPYMKDLTLAKGYKLGHFFFAINVSSLIDLDNFKNTAGNICRSLRNSKKTPGEERIYTAGEKEYYISLEREKNGIPVNKSIQKDMLIMQDELKLEKYNFPF